MFSEDTELRKAQEEFLVALQYFHKLCIDNDIQYSLHGGSLLGAIRENGFIPWDDDIDTSMTRENYEKFKKIMECEILEEGFSFDDVTTRMPHFCLKRENKPLVWITVFVYDYISENYLAKQIKYFIIKYFMLILTPKKEELMQGVKGKSINNKIKRCVEEVIWTLGNRKERKTILNRFDKFSKLWLVGKKQQVFRSNDTPEKNGIYITLPANIMDGYQIVLFEGQEVMINKMFDIVLSTSYGKDYMIPKRDDSKQSQHEKLRNQLIG